MRAQNSGANAQPCAGGSLIDSMVNRMMIDVTMGTEEDPILESMVLAKNVNPNFVQ